MYIELPTIGGPPGKGTAVPVVSSGSAQHPRHFVSGRLAGASWLTGTWRVAAGFPPLFSYSQLDSGFRWSCSPRLYAAAPNLHRLRIICIEYTITLMLVRLGSKLAGDLGQHVQQDHRENESHRQKKHNQWVHSQALRLVREQLQHRGRRTAGSGGSGGQRQLVRILGLLVSGVLSLGGASQSTWGNCRRLEVSMAVFFIGLAALLRRHVPLCKWATSGWRLGVHVARFSSRPRGHVPPGPPPDKVFWRQPAHAPPKY